jgi:hypothetical protein
VTAIVGLVALGAAGPTLERRACPTCMP